MRVVTEEKVAVQGEGSGSCVCLGVLDDSHSRQSEKEPAELVREAR
jgi:hypothetical protein